VKAQYAFYDSLYTIYGCDSIVVTSFIFSEYHLDQKNLLICLGDSTLIENSWYKEDTIIIDTIQAANICDTIKLYMLKVVSPDTSRFDTTICEGMQLLFENQVYITSGSYEIYKTQQNGCKNLMILNLMVDQCSILTKGNMKIF